MLRLQHFQAWHDDVLRDEDIVTLAGSEGTQGYMSAASGFAEAAAPIVAGASMGMAGSAAPHAPLPQASVFISNPFEGAWSIRGSGEHGGPTLASSHGSGVADSNPNLTVKETLI